MKTDHRSKHKGTAVERILIYRLGSLGDTVVALPCFQLIAREFPNAKRVLLTNFPVQAEAPAAAAVLGQSGLVHGYMRYTVGTRNPMELVRLALEIRQFRPDVLIYLMPVRPLKYIRQVQYFFRFAGIRRFVGLPEAEDLIRQPDFPNDLYEREASRLARGIRELGDANPDNVANWNLCLTKGEREAAILWLGSLIEFPIIACGPGTKMQANDWGMENWRALITQLHMMYPQYGLVLVGAKEDAEMADYVALNWMGPKINLCGKQGMPPSIEKQLNINSVMMSQGC